MKNRIKEKSTKKNIRKVLLGSRGEEGILSKTFVYIILIGISFIFLYPVLKMLMTSFMGVEDLLDSTVMWLPTKFVFANYKKAFEVINFFESLKDSFIVAFLPTIFAVISSSLIGYGFARYNFPLKKFWFATVLVVFLLPTLLMSIPTYVIYNKIGILKSLKAYIYPALTGFGLRQSVFIFIFYQFFKMIPNELSESAEIDGAGAVRTFFSIGVPMASQAFIICTLYSFVWYWNETTLATSYFQGEYTTLQLALSSFEYMYRTLYPAGSVGIGEAATSFNQGVLFAGTMLTILPLLILYSLTQKWFVESADKAGIAGN